MWRKLAAGEYSLKMIFWVFGVLGFFLFMILTGITHSSFARMLCARAHSVSYCMSNLNVLYYIGTHFISLLLSGGALATRLMLHLIASGCFGAYMIVVVRGLWKCAKEYKGSKFWVWSAKILLLGLCVLGLRAIL